MHLKVAKAAVYSKVVVLLLLIHCYLRRFSESRSSNGSTLSVRLSVRPQHFRGTKFV